MTPRQRFLKSPDAKKHFDLTATEPFHNASDTALLEYTRIVGTQPTNDPNEAMARYHQLVGAVEVLRVFSTLAEPETSITRKDTMNLNHGV